MNAPQGFITATETRSVKTPQGRLDASASQASTAPTKASKSNSTGKSLLKRTASVEEWNLNSINKRCSGDEPALFILGKRDWTLESGEKVSDIFCFRAGDWRC